MLSEVLADLLSECYFVTPYEEVKAALGWPDEKLHHALREALGLEVLQLLVFEEEPNEYFKRELAEFHALPNFSTLESFSDFAPYAYLATRKGLMAMHGGGSI
jgi:hypothetical protein